MVNKNIIGLFPNLARAFEIAMLGYFKINVVCTDNYKNALEDYKIIKNFYGAKHFSAKGEMILQLVKPENYNERKSESIEDIHNRVYNARVNNKKPTDFKGEECFALFGIAEEKLDFSIFDKSIIKNIASVIAQLDDSRHVEPVHIAEAIQYRTEPAEYKFIKAENSMVVFGDGDIRIKKHAAQSDIKKAIEYLKKLL